MKQWLYNGWFRFKAWALFSWWKFSHTEEESKDLIDLYCQNLWEKRAMKAYVDYLDAHREKLRKYEPESWYIGTINPEKMMNACLEKKDD